ncbi:MAG: hypothetical protein JSR96_00715 [Proteobacteria bacterium]|nr:hypothetical protein [Pseudomonadota bacterium]
MTVALRQRRLRPRTVAVAPATVQFGYASVAGGWTLLTDAAIAAGKTYTTVSADQGQAAAWVGVIRGTDARVRMSADFSTNLSDLLRVSVDGGPFASPGAPDANGEYALFAGLADGPHFVAFMPKLIGGTGANLYAFMPSTGNVLRVTGSSPDVSVAGEWTQIGDANAKTTKPMGLIPTGSDGRHGASRTPLNRAAWNTGSFTGTQRTGTQNLIALATASPELWVVSQYRYVHLWDGTVLSQFDSTTAMGIGADMVRVHRITGLSGQKTYHVFGGANATTPVGAWFSVGVPAGQSFASLPLPQAHLFGDSITQGVDPTAASDDRNSGFVDLFRAFARRGYAVGNFGSGGWTAGNLDTNLAGMLAVLNVSASDVAHVAIGQNATPTAAEITSIASKLIAKGYGKVIFRGVLPVITGSHPAKNTVISGALNAMADPRIRYIDPNSWTELAVNTPGVRNDGIHFLPSGYDLLLNRMDVTLPNALA